MAAGHENPVCRGGSGRAHWAWPPSPAVSWNVSCLCSPPRSAHSCAVPRTHVRCDRLTASLPASRFSHPPHGSTVSPHLSPPRGQQLPGLCPSSPRTLPGEAHGPPAHNHHRRKPGQRSRRGTVQQDRTCVPPPAHTAAPTPVPSTTTSQRHRCSRTAPCTCRSAWHLAACHTPSP